MKKLTVRSVVASLPLMLLFLLLCALPLTLAAASGTQEIPRFTLASSGTGASELFVLVGSVGQATVGASNNSDFSLHGGFWSTTEEPSSGQNVNAIYLPHLTK